MSKPTTIQYTGKYANHLLREKEQEIERLNNIIKEVREYIENNLYGDYGYECKQSKKELLEILGKENK